MLPLQAGEKANLPWCNTEALFVDAYGRSLERTSFQHKAAIIDLIPCQLLSTYATLYDYSSMLADRYSERLTAVLVVPSGQCDSAEFAGILSGLECHSMNILAAPLLPGDISSFSMMYPASAIVDSTCSVRFFSESRAISNDTKRQLVEKILLGEVQVVPPTERHLHTRFQAGGFVPDLSVLSSDTEITASLRDLAARHKVWVLLPVDCSKCQLGEFRVGLHKVLEAFAESTVEIAVLSTGQVSTNDLETLFEGHQRPISQFRAVLDPADPIIYWSRRSARVDPHIVILSDKGVVLANENLSEVNADSLTALLPLLSSAGGD